MSAEEPEPTSHHFFHRAMATHFELFVYDQEYGDAMHISEAVFAEVDRLEQLLSFFIPWSDVAQINRLALNHVLPVSAEAFSCISLARTLSELTEGAYDLTAGALLRDRKPWDEGSDGVGGETPELKAQPVIDYRAIMIDPENREIGRLADGIAIDLGGIAKGFALDQLRAILADWDVASALVHAGQSTMLPYGRPPEGETWPMRLLDPRNETDVLGHFDVSDEAVSASGATDVPHILDPATARPATGWLGAWAIAQTAAEADALSTAFMVMPAERIEAFCAIHPGVRALMIDTELSVACIGDWSRHPLRGA